MTRCFPIVDDPGQFEPDPIKEEEAIREQAFELLVSSLRDALARHGRHYLFATLADAAAFDEPWGADSSVTEDQIKQFADTYGWPSAVRAIARALETDEQFKTELEARR